MPVILAFSLPPRLTTSNLLLLPNVPWEARLPKVKNHWIKDWIDFMFYIRKNKSFGILSRHMIMPQACSKRGIVKYSPVLYPVDQERECILKILTMAYNLGYMRMFLIYILWINRPLTFTKMKFWWNCINTIYIVFVIVCFWKLKDTESICSEHVWSITFPISC